MLFLKEHIRGSVRECETISLDILTKMRCKELKCKDLYNGVPVVVKSRNVEDRFGGKGRTRCLGALCDIFEDELWNAALRCVVLCNPSLMLHMCYNNFFCLRFFFGVYEKKNCAFHFLLLHMIPNNV